LRRGGEPTAQNSFVPAPPTYKYLLPLRPPDRVCTRPGVREGRGMVINFRNYLVWSEIEKLIVSGAHKTPSGLATINDLRSKLNK
jgi:hypothetical protein